VAISPSAGKGPYQNAANSNSSTDHLALLAFAQDEATGEDVVESAFVAPETDVKAVDHKIIDAQSGHVDQEAAGTEPHAGLPKIHWLAGGVGHIKPQQPLSQSRAPTGTLRDRKVEPSFKREEANTQSEIYGPELGKQLVERRSLTMIEKGIRDSHGRSRKRNKDRKRNHEENQIDDARHRANPESRAGR